MVKINHFPRSVQIINLNGKILIGANYYNCSAHDIITGKKIMQLKKLEAEIKCVAVNGFGDLVAIPQNRSVIIIDIQSRKTLKLVGHSAQVNQISFDPHSQFLATGSSDSTVRLWDIKTGKQIQIYIGHKEGILHLHFNSDGDKLITCSYENAARIWDVKSGLCIHVLDEHKDFVLCSKFDYTGDYCATGSKDSTCKIWDVKTGKCIQTLRGHVDAIINLSFNINGTRILTTSFSNTGRVQNIKTGECVLQLIRCGNDVQYLLPKNLIITDFYLSSPRIYSEAGELLQILQFGGGTKLFCYSSKFDGVIVVASGDNAKFQIWKNIKN